MTFTRESQRLGRSAGTYERVVGGQATSGRSLLQRLYKLGPIISLLFLGQILMIVHHIFYAHLNGKSTDNAAGELPVFLRDQNNVIFLGTIVAHGARIVLSMAVGATFVQLLWETLRSRSHTLQQTDALVKCGDSPFHLSSFRAATTSFPIYLVSFIASSMAILVIITPGSLTISLDYQRTKPCSVPTVPSVMDLLFEDLNDDLRYLAIGIMTSNSYYSPFQVDRDTVCGVGASTCTYNVSFVAPAMDCIDVTNQTDFSSFLKLEDPLLGALDCIYSTVENEDEVLSIEILTQDLVEGATQAINCTAHNATYEVGVNLDVDTTSVHVWNVTLRSPLLVTSDYSAPTFLSSYASHVVDTLIGAVFAGPNGYSGADSSIASTTILHNTFFVTTPSGNHTWSEDVPQFPISFMQNASLSLLSGNVNYNFSNETSSNLIYINSTCSSTFTAYAYDPVRLLVPYGIALALTALVAAWGCWLIIRNGEEEKIMFSHIVQIGLNEKLFYISGEMHAKALVNLQRGDAGKLLLARHNDDGHDTYSMSSFDSDRDLRKIFLSEAPRLTFMSWKANPSHCHAYGLKSMAFIFLVALCPILGQHFYYHYLDGRSPSNFALKSLCIKGCSDEIRNQTAVSDIGIALAYISQTLLATVIVIADKQVFWRRMRSCPIRIAQIDALMNVRTNPFCLSFLRALRASFSLIILAILAFSMSLLSVFVPGAISIAEDFTTSKDCIVQKPRNLTAVNVFNNTQSNSSILSYSTPIITVLSSGSYLPPLNPCDEDSGTSDGPVRCEYRIDFTAPGFDCKDVTATSNSTGIVTTNPFIPQGQDQTLLFLASRPPQTEDLILRLSVQTYDFRSAIYQAVNCTGVLRQYSTIISHNKTSVIDTFETRVDSTIQANANQTVNFPATLVNNIMSTINEAVFYMDRGLENGIFITPIAMGNIGTLGLDGNITWRDNMTVALEEFAQNVTLSLLSGQIFSFNPEDPELLENTTTTCTYTFTAYKYSPYRLFVPYGVAVLVTLLCIIWGWSAIRRNGVEESMDFSRFLRAILNERMYEARDYLDKNSKVKSDDTVEGDLVPISSNH